MNAVLGSVHGGELVTPLGESEPVDQLYRRERVNSALCVQVRWPAADGAQAVRPRSDDTTDGPEHAGRTAADIICSCSCHDDAPVPSTIDLAL